MSIGDKPAYPQAVKFKGDESGAVVGGMTLRQYYAGLAMQL